MESWVKFHKPQNISGTSAKAAAQAWWQVEVVNNANLNHFGILGLLETWMTGTFFLVFFTICVRQVPVYYSWLGECLKAALFGGSRIVLWTAARGGSGWVENALLFSFGWTVPLAVPWNYVRCWIQKYWKWEVFAGHCSFVCNCFKVSNVELLWLTVLSCIQSQL